MGECVVVENYEQNLWIDVESLLCSLLLMENDTIVVSVARETFT